MARDAAIITTWDGPVPGREAKSLEVFGDFVTFWGKRAADGKCSEPETYFAMDGSSGLSIVRGKLDDLMEIWASEENEILLGKAHMIVQNLRAQFHLAGEEVTTGLQRYMQALTELGVPQQ